jgi:transposase-like protein
MIRAEDVAYQMKGKRAAENVIDQGYPVWSTARHFRVIKEDLQEELDRIRVAAKESTRQLDSLYHQ